MVDEGGIENLMMGTGSEKTQESKEALAARLTAAQVQLATTKKQEGHDRTYDEYLAQVLRSLPVELIDLVIAMVNHEVPSLTILAFLSLVVEAAKKPFDAEPLMTKGAKQPMPEFSESTETLGPWFGRIAVAEQVSFTVRLRHHKESKTFMEYLDQVLLGLAELHLKHPPADPLKKELLSQLQALLRPQA